MNSKNKRILKLLGIGNLRNVVLHFYRYPDFIKDYLKFRRLYSQSNDKRFGFNVLDSYPCINDKTVNTGFDRHYVFHTAWAARKVRQISPTVHHDISSSVYFNAIVSAFVPINFYDYRPAVMNLSGLSSKPGDLHKLPFEDCSIASLSCMHVIEHIGLGRYGEPLDYEGDLKAIVEIKRVISEGGHVLFVVPIGKNIIMFNAHRIYTYKQIIEYFRGFDLLEFSLIEDNQYGGTIVENASEGLSNSQVYGCGMFWFRKSSMQ
jgi:hypothetical protein